MFQMRPGVKFKMWAPRFKNRPEVEPPGLLKAVSALSMFSIVGTLFYAVLQSLSGLAELGIEAAYVAMLHFILPLGVVYTVTANSPLSRIVIVTYTLILSSATFAGKGWLASLPVFDSYGELIIGAFLTVVLTWLFASPKMRFYYALLSGKPVPQDLAARADELHGGIWLSANARERLSWFLDHLEILVLVGFIVLVLYALSMTGSM